MTKTTRGNPESFKKSFYVWYSLFITGLLKENNDFEHFQI